MDTYITVPVVVSRQRLDALHAARNAAGLSALTDSQMVYIAMQVGEAIELQCYADLTPEAA